MTPSGPPATDPEPLEPILFPDERQELACLAFFQAELERLGQRTLISEEAFATVAAETRQRRDAIEFRGFARAEFQAARGLSTHYPKEALERAERARRADPSRREAWDLELDLRHRLADEEGALSLCAAGATRFPGFPTPDEYRARLAAAQVPADVSAARAALDRGDYENVVALCTAILDTKTGPPAATRAVHTVVALCNAILDAKPDHLDATVLLACACRRLGRHAEALSLYQRLTVLQPDNPVWPQWVANLEIRSARSPQPEPVAETPRVTAASPESAQIVPRMSLRTIANEFLQEHWKNLLLCLGVLLIVVASNVGAYQLLGPRLWSPVGKCVLALVYTAMFAGLGIVLARWGAERAGRVMLLTTLIVIPANFMLMGQMKLLTEPSAASLAVLGLDAAVLFGLIRVVASSLRASHKTLPLTKGELEGVPGSPCPLDQEPPSIPPPRGGKAEMLNALRAPRGVNFLATMIFTISAFNAAAAPGSPWPHTIQFALFVVPAFLVLGSEIWLTTRFQEGEFDDRREMTYGALGLLTFIFLSGLIRSGVFALAVLPTLYALPVMVLAVACVHAAGRLARFDPDPQHAAWLRFGGLCLSGLAFALALARPEGAIYSGSTLATALVGLGLYAALLNRERRPAYLYFGFGALFLAYFGVFYFTKDLMAAIEQTVGHMLGYERKLPFAFKSINGLVFSPVLAALSLWIRRHWNDERLARHCHFIGVPFAVGACVLSGFEPKAAVICLTGYALLFTLAVPVFAAPQVIYLAVAAAAGATYFASTFWPGTTLAVQGWLAAALGLTAWAVGFGLKSRGVDASYRFPLGQAALVLAALGAIACGVAGVWTGHVVLASALAFLMACLTFVLVDREMPERWLSHAAAAAGNVGLVLLAVYAGGRWWGGPTDVQVACATAAVGVLSVVVASWLRRADLIEGSGTYPAALERAAFAQVGLTLVLCGLYAGRLADRLAPADFAAGALALGLSAAALGVLSRPYPSVALAHLTVACGLGVWLCVFQVALGGAFARCAAYSAVASTYALVLLALEEAAQAYARKRKSAETDFHAAAGRAAALFGRALPEFEVAVVLGAVALGAYGFANGPALIVTLASGAAAMLWATRLRPLPRLVDLSIVLGVMAAWSCTAWRLEGALGGLRVAALGLTTAVAAAALWAAGWFSERRPRLALYARPTTRAALVLPFLAAVLALFGNMATWQAYPLSASALGLNVVVLTLLSATRRQPATTYRAVVSLVLMVYGLIFSLGTGSPDTVYVLGLVAAGIALLLQAIGFALRNWDDEVNTLDRVFARPLFVSSAVLALLAGVPAYNSPWAALLIAAAFLVLVKGWPSQYWLYPTVGALVTGLYWGFLSHLPVHQFVTAALVLAYQLWLLGALTRRVEPALIHWLKLTERGYDLPLFNSAAVFCCVAVLLRIDETTGGGPPWYDSAGLALNLAVFAVLMVKAYPSSAWINLVVVFASGSAALAAYPRIDSPLLWLPLGMAVATGWSAVVRLAEGRVETFCRWCGVPEKGYLEPVVLWSRALFAVSLLVTIGIVIQATCLEALLGRVSPSDPTGGWAWAGVLAALALAGVYATVTFARIERFSPIYFWHGLGLLAVWWLAAPISPLVARYGMNPLLYLPLATAAVAALTTGLGLSWTSRPAWPALFWRFDLPADPAGRFDAYAARAGLVLAVVAAVLTRGDLNATTAATFTVATIAPVIAAARRQWVAAAYASGLFATAALVVAGAVAAPWLGVASDGDRFVAGSAGALAAGAGLWIVAGGLRRRDGLPPSTPDDAQCLPAATVPLAWEQAALCAAVVSAGAIVATLARDAPGIYGHATAVGVLFGIALLLGGLVLRWGTEWLVYLAQSSLLGGYLYYRRANPLPTQADIVVLTLFGYVDLGLAEVLHRFGLARFARPTRIFALLLPVLPIGLALTVGGLGDARLFVLFAVATFYGIACLSLGWKPLGYAAAVLYNAFLWLLWGRIGWAVADHSQFFLIPVGLSAVLFAEVNRRELGRSAVNAIRGVGLAVIYLSLAVPVWQFASLGAWVTLLLVSLMGIFVGIGLRVQIFLWMGLAGFLLDVLYQLGRMGMEHTLAKWAIMLGLGLLLVLFVALNEKKRIVSTLRDYIGQARQWQ